MNSFPESNVISDLFTKKFGHEADTSHMLKQSGSDRIYMRLSDSHGNSAIASYGNNLKENNSFLSLAEAFKSEGILVPEIYGVSDSGFSYLQEDLGDQSLFSLINSDISDSLLEKVIKQLIKVQTMDRKKWSALTFASDFSRRQIHWDLNYFKYCFMLPSTSFYNEEKLEDDFNHLESNLLNTPHSLWGFMYRDFQSRNIMVKGLNPYFIDFQGGRYGPLIYDIISFLYQAKARFSTDFRNKWLNLYSELLAEKRQISPEIIKSFIPDFIIFRLLQVLGAYGFRGLMQHKAHFLQSIPYALCNFTEIIDSGYLDQYPELKRIINELTDKPEFKIRKESAGLQVEIFSFSYKKGYPVDFSGNGGGFMFDCRALHNPGRYDEYKSLTGLDTPVINFLEEKGEVRPFLESLWHITDKAVRKYIKRGFTNLQIGFGCTGGQHRSVYCAEMTGKHIADLFPDVKITVSHREQNIIHSPETTVK